MEDNEINDYVKWESLQFLNTFLSIWHDIQFQMPLLWYIFICHIHAWVTFGALGNDVCVIIVPRGPYLLNL